MIGPRRAASLVSVTLRDSGEVALIDGEADVASRWYLAPMQGETVVRDLLESFGTRSAVMVGDRATDAQAAHESAIPHVHGMARDVRMFTIGGGTAGAAG